VAGAADGALAVGWDDVIEVAEHAATRRLAMPMHAANTGMAPIRGDVADWRLRQDARVMAASMRPAQRTRGSTWLSSLAPLGQVENLRDTLSPTLMLVALMMIATTWPSPSLLSACGPSSCGTSSTSR
jgi:hypothetical protein